MHSRNVHTQAACSQFEFLAFHACLFTLSSATAVDSLLGKTLHAVLHCYAPAGTFLDLYVGRVTKASGSSSSRPSANYTVVWKHEEDCIVIDGTTAGNILADVNDTA